MSFDVKSAETYLIRHVNDLSIAERQELLQMIVNADVPDRFIRTKGNGTEITLKYIPENTFIDMYNYVKKKISDKQQALESLP